MNKTVVGALGIGIVAIGAYSYRKYKAAKKIIAALKVRTKSIKHLKIGFKKVSFTIALELINTTDYDLGFTGGSVIYLKNIKVYDLKKTLLADIDTKITALKLGAHSSQVLPDLQVELPTRQLIANIGNLAAYINNNNLLYKLTISAFKREFTIQT